MKDAVTYILVIDRNIVNLYGKMLFLRADTKKLFIFGLGGDISPKLWK